MAPPARSVTKAGPGTHVYNATEPAQAKASIALSLRAERAVQVEEPAAEPVTWSSGQRERVRSQSSGSVTAPSRASSLSQSCAGTRHRTSSSMPLGSFAYSDLDTR